LVYPESFGSCICARCPSVFVGGKNEIRSYFFLNRSFVVSVPHMNFHKHVNLGISRARFLSINQPRRKIIVLVLSPVRSRLHDKLKFDTKNTYRVRAYSPRSQTSAMLLQHRWRSLVES
jgi:hypothetical protein